MDSLCYKNIMSRVPIRDNPNKGYGMIANRDIAKDEIVFIDDVITLDKDTVIYSDMFQLLYKILQDKKLTKKFMRLCPKTTDDITKRIKTEVFDELNRIKQIDRTMHSFFVSNYTEDDILLYCLKYVRNAFNFRDKPSILFIGRMLNHSCNPNTVFKPYDNDHYGNKMVFICCRNIKKGEEITDSYVDIKYDINKRKKRLKEQYGFDCECDRCKIELRV